MFKLGIEGRLVKTNIDNNIDWINAVFIFGCKTIKYFVRNEPLIISGEIDKNNFEDEKLI